MFAPAPNPAQLRRLVGIGVKETQAAFRGSRAARLPLLIPALATIFPLSVVVH
jgi:hypothetical protein